MAFEKFKDFLSKTKLVEGLAKGVGTDLKNVPVMKHFTEKSFKSGVDLAINFLPLITGSLCAIGGIYGLEAYLGIKLAQGIRDNLNKNKLLSDPQKDWYNMIGAKLVNESDYNKNKDKLKEKISDSNSILAYWKNLYDK